MLQPGSLTCRIVHGRRVTEQVYVEWPRGQGTGLRQCAAGLLSVAGTDGDGAQTAGIGYRCCQLRGGYARHRGLNQRQLDTEALQQGGGRAHIVSWLLMCSVLENII